MRTSVLALALLVSVAVARPRPLTRSPKARTLTTSGTKSKSLSVTLNSKSSTSSAIAARVATSVATVASSSAARSPQASTSSTVAASPSGYSKKKGLGFNTASYTNGFNLAWAYDWSSKVDGTTGSLNRGAEFTPMLWNTDNTSWAANAQAAINAGTTHLLGFNEPDLSSQSNISPKDAAAAWLQNIEPFHTQASLVSPAITNGGPPLGITWMSDFLGNCSTCHIDAIAAHWYDSATARPQARDNIGYFQNYFTDMYNKFGKPIWITEFAGSGTVAQQQQFFQTILPWMESQPFIQRYAAVGDFAGTFVYSNGTLTPLGQTYNSVA